MQPKYYWKNRALKLAEHIRFMHGSFSPFVVSDLFHGTWVGFWELPVERTAPSGLVTTQRRRRAAWCYSINQTS